ncbi:MAG: GumC family protein [Terriglobia bacterium]
MIRREPFEQHNLTWHDCLGLYRKYRWVVLIIFLAVVAGSWISLQIFFPTLYETQADLLVKIGRENASTPPTVQNGAVLTQGVSTTEINSEVEMLSSRALVEQVVNELGQERFLYSAPKRSDIWGYPKYFAKLAAHQIKSWNQDLLIALGIEKRLTPHQEAIVRLAGGVDVEPIRQSDILELKLRTPSPQLCVDAANALLQAYLDRRIKVMSNEVGTSFFDGQLSHYNGLMQKYMNERAQIRSQWGVAAPDTQRTLLLDQLSNLKKQSIEAQSEMDRLSTQSRSMAEQMRSFPSMLPKEQTITPSPSSLSIKSQLTALQLERAKVESGYLPQSETVKKIDQQIAALAGLLQHANPTITASSTQQANPVTSDFTQQMAGDQAEIHGLQAQVQSLNRSAADIRDQLNRLNSGADKYNNAELQYNIAEQDYLSYAKRAEEARLSQQLDALRIANVSLVAPPYLPIEPVAPKKLLIMGVSIPAGLLLGIAFAGLLETLDDRIESERDLAAIDDVPFLGAVTLNEKRMRDEESLQAFSGPSIRR